MIGGSMLSRQDRVLHEQVGPDSLLVYTDTSNDLLQDITLEDYQLDVLVNLSGTGTAVVTLPSVAGAKGKIYSVRAVTDGAGVTIQDRDDSLEWADLITDADGEYALLYSNGMQWFVLKTDIT
jgi:hypothetical protein